jgi:hypothetical protein
LSFVLVCFCAALVAGCGGGESVKYPDVPPPNPQQKKELEKPKPKNVDTN